MNIRKINGQDICHWPDGSWCFYEDLSEYNWLSDDYEVLVEGSPQWELLTQVQGEPS